MDLLHQPKEIDEEKKIEERKKKNNNINRRQGRKLIKMGSRFKMCHLLYNQPSSLCKKILWFMKDTCLNMKCLDTKDAMIQKKKNF